MGAAIDERWREGGPLRAGLVKADFDVGWSVRFENELRSHMRRRCDFDREGLAGVAPFYYEGACGACGKRVRFRVPAVLLGKIDFGKDVIFVYQPFNGLNFRPAQFSLVSHGPFRPDHKQNKSARSEKCDDDDGQVPTFHRYDIFARG